MNHAGIQGYESRMRLLLRPNTLYVEASHQTADYPNRPSSRFHMQMGAKAAAGETFFRPCDGRVLLA